MSMEAPKKSDPLLNVKEVASMWGVNEETVRRWVRLGRLPVLRIMGTMRFRRRDVIAAAEKYEHGDPDQDRRRDDPSMG